MALDAGPEIVNAENAVVVLCQHCGGMITGSAGGLIRDLLTAKIPLLLQRDIYATAAAGGIALYLILRACRADRIVALIAGVATVTGLRVTAVFLDWQLPVFHMS